MSLGNMMGGIKTVKEHMDKIDESMEIMDIELEKLEGEISTLEVVDEDTTDSDEEKE